MYAAAVGSEQVMLTLLKAGAARAIMDAQVGVMHSNITDTSSICAVPIAGSDSLG
jgi:hypothetical protein